MVNFATSKNTGIP